MKNISRSMFILSFLMLFSLGAQARVYHIPVEGSSGCITVKGFVNMEYTPGDAAPSWYELEITQVYDGCRNVVINGLQSTQTSIKENENFADGNNVEETDKWSLYPNPASNYVKVKYNLSESSYKKHQNVSVSLVNIYGGTTVITDAHKIYSSTLTGTKGELLVNLSNIPKGMYWLMVMGENDEVLTTKKLIK